MTTTTRQAVNLECRLTIASRLECECAAYLVTRRKVLIPEVIRVAIRHKVDPVDLFAAYARGVHARHESGLSLATEEAA